MPRLSAESRSAALWRASSDPPDPPRYLGREARKLWREIVASRVPDHFRPGSLELLAAFVVESVALRRALQALDQSPEDGAALARVKVLSPLVASLAVKLCLAISSAWKPNNGRLDERQGATSLPPLIGGHALRRQ